MDSLYYSVELLIIAAVPILNSFGIKVSYWVILLVFITHFIQASFHQAQNDAQEKKLKDLYNTINKLQNTQKDIMSRQRDLNDDIKLGGYN